MSLINDALKQARQAPPRNTPSTLPPLQPAHDESSHTAVWLVPAIIIFLVFAAIFAVGWAAAHRKVNSIVEAPPDPATTQQVEVVRAPFVPEPTPVPVVELPRLQLQLGHRHGAQAGAAGERQLAAAAHQVEVLDLRAVAGEA
ncbi:MAG: hypothetical protein RL616_1733, partial [Verrucomicrobiota bacterium]